MAVFQISILSITFYVYNLLVSRFCFGMEGRATTGRPEIAFGDTSRLRSSKGRNTLDKFELVSKMALLTGLAGGMVAAPVQVAAQVATEVENDQASEPEASPAEPATASAEPAAASQGGGQEIIVTATRRSESLQNVPLSVTVLDGEAALEQGILSSEDVVRQVPNMNFASTGPLPVYSIRGVQLLEILALGNEPPVGVYFDDVYVGTLAGQSSQLFDVENVQVLRGPQGTLFGRNTTGGLVNYISRKPTHHPEGYLFARFGRFNQRILEGAVSGAITDGLRVRAAARYNEDDGFQENLAPVGGRFGAVDTLSGRLLVEADLGPNIEALLNVHGSRIRNTSQLYGSYGRLDPATGAVCSAERIFAAECVNRDGFRYDPKPTNGYTEQSDLATDIDLEGASLTLTGNFGDVEIVSLTSFGAFDRYYEEDVDGTAAPRFLAFYRERAEQFTQELRFVGDTAGVEWVGGFFYYNDERETEFALPQLIDTLVPILGPVIGTAGLRNRADVDTESWALFGQADIPLTDDLTLTAGLRYTHEAKDLFMSDNPAAPNRPLLQIIEREISDDPLTWRLGLNWQATPDALIYGSVAKGFKSGVFNTRGGVYSTLANRGFVPEVAVGPEEVISYELGAKTELGYGAVTLNGALFYSDYRNLQVTAVDRSIQDFLLSNLLNAGDADIYGAEIELAAQITNELSLNLGAGLLHTEINSDVDINGIPLDGNELPKAPSWSINGLLRYDIPADLFDGVLSIQTEFKLQGAEWTSPENILEERQGAYQVVNLRLLWESNSERFNASIFVENLFDEEYQSFNYSSFDYVNAYWQRPFWWGATVGVRF